MIIVKVYNPQVIDPDPVKYSEKIWAAIRRGSPGGTILNIGIDYRQMEESNKGTPTLAITVEDDTGGNGRSVARVLTESFHVKVKWIQPSGIITVGTRGWVN